MSDEEIQFKVRLPEHLKRAIDAHPDTNKSLAYEALRSRLGVTDKSAIDLRIEQKDRRLEIIDEEIAELKEERAEVMEERESLVKRREQMKAPDEKYRDDLNELLSQLEDGEYDRLIPSMVPVRNVADEHGEDSETVHDDLKELAAEQDRRIFNTQFMQPREAEQVNIADKELIGDAFGGDGE